MLKNMYSSADRNEFACNLLIPLIEKEISNRRVISLPTNEQMRIGLRLVLEELADSVEG